MSSTTDPILALSETLAVLRDHVLDTGTLAAIATELRKTAADAAKARASDRQPKAKSRHVILLRSDDKAVCDAVAAGAYVLTVPDDDTTLATYSGDALLARLSKAVQHHNDTPARGRRKHRPIKTFTEAMEHLKPKALSHTDSPKLRIKTRLPVEVVIVTRETFPL
jgi:hypothetical protein